MSQGATPAIATAMEEVEAILKKHDLVGVVSLYDGACAEFRVCLSSWVGMAQVQEGDVGGIDVTAEPSNISQWNKTRGVLGLMVKCATAHYVLAEKLFGKLQKLGEV